MLITATNCIISRTNTDRFLFKFSQLQNYDYMLEPYTYRFDTLHFLGLLNISSRGSHGNQLLFFEYDMNTANYCTKNMIRLTCEVHHMLIVLHDV